MIVRNGGTLLGAPIYSVRTAVQKGHKMAINVGRKEVENLKKRAEGAMARLKGVKEKAENAAGRVVDAATIGGTSFLMGVVNGRFLDPATGKRGLEVLGVPVEVIATVGFHVLGFMSSDKYGTHLHNFGNGALASYTNILGIGVGDKMRQTAARAATAPAQVPASTSGVRLNEAQMRDMMRR